MVKYRMYIDLYAGIDPAQYGLHATTKPGVKIENAKRIAFDVVIPDEIMFDVDAVAAEVTRPEIVEA